MKPIALVRRDEATLVPVEFNTVDEAVAYAQSRADVEKILDEEGNAVLVAAVVEAVAEPVLEPTEPVEPPAE